MALAPVDYGPPVQADDSGVNTMRGAIAQHEQVFANARELGSKVEGGAQVIAQGILHVQALKATAAVKEKQASTLQFIEANPYVSKAVLQQRMSPDDYQAWHAGLAAEYQDQPSVPMYTAAGSLFDSEAKQAREQAGQVISLPGWRTEWAATEQSESATIRERYVNRAAADQLSADQRAQTQMSIDSMVASAQKKEDLNAPAVAASTSPWFHPAERRQVERGVRVAQDSFDAEKAMRTQDVKGMGDELSKLRSDNAAEMYPHMNEKQRLDLTQRLERQFGFHAAKQEASDLVSKHVDENGKVDAVAIDKDLAAYKGDNKDEVTKAVRAQTAESLNLFDDQASAVQQTVFSAGQDPKDGFQFSMSRALSNPDAAKAADWLNKNSPGKLDALVARDTRVQRANATDDRRAAADAAKKQIQTSHDNLESIRRLLDDETQADSLRKLTPAQWDSQLHDVAGGLTDGDIEQARKDFSAFQKRGGKPDERAINIVNEELKAAAKGDPSKVKALSSKYQTQLIAAAHAAIRANPDMDRMDLGDAVHKAVRAELIRGSVVGGGSVWGDANGVVYADWETNPQYAGKDFQTSDGAVISSSKQPPVRLTKDGVTYDFRPENAAAAKAAGWK